MRFQETILGRLGKTLHVRLDDIAHEPLPRRWVELIQHLNQRERIRTAIDRDEIPQRERPD
jgi:hypothetical protein